MKQLIFLVLILFTIACGDIKKTKIKTPEKAPEINLQTQLDDEFGKYIEDIKPGDSAYYKAYDKSLALFGVPFHELYIQTSFGKAHVIACGPSKGEPIVLLHGMNASSTMWYPNIKALAENNRVYAIDFLMEPGKSQVEGDIEEMEQVIQWYNEIFNQLKLKKFILIGASRGGWLAVKLALQHKLPITKMVLLSPAQTFKWIPLGTKVLSNLTYSIAPKRKNLRSVLKTMSSNVDNIEMDYMDQYFISTQKASINKLILQMTPYSDDEIKSIDIPVLVLIGDKDIINNIKAIETAKALLPNATTGIITEAGHFLSFDQSDTINNKILHFIDSKQPPPL